MHMLSQVHEGLVPHALVHYRKSCISLHLYMLVGLLDFRILYCSADHGTHGIIRAVSLLQHPISPSIARSRWHNTLPHIHIYLPSCHLPSATMHHPKDGMYKLKITIDHNRKNGTEQNRRSQSKIRGIIYQAP